MVSSGRVAVERLVLKNAHFVVVVFKFGYEQLQLVLHPVELLEHLRSCRAELRPRVASV